MAYCGHCGYALSIYTRKQADGATPRGYRCAGMTVICRAPCPGAGFAMNAPILDPLAWGESLAARLRDEKNVTRPLADWQRARKQGRDSMALRLAAAEAQIASLHDRMASLTQAISEVSAAASRAALTSGLDDLSAQLAREHVKREQLVREAADERAYALGASEMREWARLVSERAGSFTREQQRDTLRALGAQLTLWRADAVHDDDWPQRYRVVLTFTGFGAQPVTLPPQSAIVTSRS